MESSSFLSIAADDVVNDSHFRWRIKFSHVKGRLPSCLYVLKICYAGSILFAWPNESYFRCKVQSCGRQNFTF